MVYDDDHNSDGISADDLPGCLLAVRDSPPSGAIHLGVMTWIGGAAPCVCVESTVEALDGMQLRPATPRAFDELRRAR